MSGAPDASTPHELAPATRDRSASRGVVFGATAYVLWGLFPLFWPLLEPAGPVEILAHRVVWSLLVVVVLLARPGGAGFGWLRGFGGRRFGLLAAAAIAIAVNWGVYIWGVNSGHVVETSLGYFVNPLVTVLLGVLVLGERLRGRQWFALGLAGVAVAVLSWEAGRPPWIALILAFSFATYGLLKKKADVGAVESLTIETGVLTPVALAYLVTLTVTGASSFTARGPGHALLLASAGVVTAVPLLFFGAAATRVPLATLGLLQYVTPMMQFAFGVIVYSEPMPPARFAGFAVLWVALAIFTVDAVLTRRGQLRGAAESMV